MAQKGIKMTQIGGAMGEFSITHLLLLGIIVLIFFGPSRLPALGQSLGKAIKGFKQGLNEIDAEVKPVQEAAQAQLKSGAGATQILSQTEKETQKA